MFLAEPREQSSKDGTTYMEVLLTLKVRRLKRLCSSTTVAELYSFMKCFGSCQFLRGLWMDIAGEVANIHMRTDAKKLVTQQEQQKSEFTTEVMTRIMLP